MGYGQEVRLKAQSTDPGDTYLACDSSGRLKAALDPEDLSLVASAARTATGNSGDQTNTRFKGLMAYVSVTAKGGTTPTLDVAVQGKDPITGDYFSLVAATQYADATGVKLVGLYPGFATGAPFNAITNIALPKVWRVLWTIAGASATFTFSVGVMLLP